MVKDPACLMDVDEQSAAGHSTHQGKTHYFCASRLSGSVSGKPWLVHVEAD
jgi:YHS domain-containing protein